MGNNDRDPRPQEYHAKYWERMNENPTIRDHFIESGHNWDLLSSEERAYCIAADQEAKQAARHALGLD